jgi:hypothetical protein
MNATACAGAFAAVSIVTLVLAQNGCGAVRSPVSTGASIAVPVAPPSSIVPTASVTPVASVVRAVAPTPLDASAGCTIDANGGSGCDFDTQVCLEGKCTSCPPGTEAFGLDECLRPCHLDAECKPSEICQYVSPAYTFCTTRPPPVTCPVGQIALKTGTCFTPCSSDDECKKIDPGLCCHGDPNSPVPICMGDCG